MLLQGVISTERELALETSLLVCNSVINNYEVLSRFVGYFPTNEAKCQGRQLQVTVQKCFQKSGQYL